MTEDHSTEEKIKQAAQKVFTQKGFAATRTRDIAMEAGINLALLNYYFRSKEKLFDIIMLENMQKFLNGMKGVFNNESLSLNDKITSLVDNYIELLTENTDLPLFILNEIKANPQKFVENMGVKTILLQSQFFSEITAKTKGKVDPLHLIINIISLTVFPFIARPLLQNIGDMDQKAFEMLMMERKKMIPVWINAMLTI